ANDSWYNKMTTSQNAVYLTWAEVGKNSSSIMFSKSTTFVPEFGTVASLVLIISVMSIVVISQRSALKARI
ncbi:MAG TPA: PEFG-CTERM sorting domain-containing protein, partial [Candidatus Nitrosotalea sp.]|nr:PEFG-CTERM sorting domain-containing protein [Candidatus Nitrosotalea sp.]